MDEVQLEQTYVVDLSNELLTLIGGVVVKREDLAQKYETLETLRSYDYYLAALTKTDAFDTYGIYDDAILIAAGLTSSEITLAKRSKLNIPENKREAIVLLQRAKVLAEYVESNNYYRTLYGLPANEDYLDIYITDPIAGVDISKPVHEMTNDEIFILNNLGHIKTLIDKYPSRSYLNYLGENRIGFVTARTAKRFDILKIGEILNSDIKNRFTINYELSKAYILNNYYKKRFSIDQTYFDAYIGFIIIINAIIMTVNDSIDIFNRKEYYNERMVKEILQSHNLDIFDDVPLVYRKKITDNIKSLIVSKGTDEVIFKIFKIFGFDNITVKKFLLVKQHQKDVNGNYIFSYETDGVTPKYDEMYEIEFSQVDVKSANIDAEIRKPENKLAYVDISSNDIYWGGYETDEAIRQKLLKEDFNYIDTDYVSIDTAYTISNLTFEVTYFLSTCLALKSSLEQLVLIDPIFGQEITLFYAITMLSALVSKKVGFVGNIITDPADIATVHKFNFDRNLTEIDNMMKKYGYSSTINFAPILPSGQIIQPVELVNLYFKNKEIYDTLVKIKTNTRDYNEYLAIRELLEYTTQSKLSSNIYLKSDGNIASTYLDYLYSKNMILATYIDTLEYTYINDVMFKILTGLEDFIQTEKFQYLFLNIPSLSGDAALKKYMLKIINIFKALTINVFTMSITYSIDNYLNNFKIIDRKECEGNLFSHNNITMTDINQFSTTVNTSEKFKFNDKLELIDSWTYL